MGGALNLVAVGKDARSVWQEVARTTSSTRPTQTPEWLDCMTEVGPYEDATRLYTAAEDRYVVLPLVRHRAVPVRTPVEYSWPEYWDYGGPLASDGHLPGDISGLVEDLTRRRVVRTGVRTILFEEEFRAWEATVPPGTWRKVTPCQVLDLSGGFEVVWGERFSSKVRSASRKALRRGVHIEQDSTGRLVPAFDALYRKSVERWAAERHESARLRRRLAARREPFSRFAAVATRLGDSCRVWIAFHEGHPAAGIVVVSHGKQVLYWRGAMDKQRVGATGANELLHRSAIEHACERGALAYDMGISVSPSLSRFKQTFGTTEAYGVEYRFETLPLSAAEETLRKAVRSAVLRGLRRGGEDPRG